MFGCSSRKESALRTLLFFPQKMDHFNPHPPLPPKSTTPPTRFPCLFPHPSSPAPPQNGSTACDANASLDLHRAIRVGFVSIQELREQIVPHAKNVPMAELLAAMDLHLEQPPSAHMVEKNESSVGLFFLFRVHRCPFSISLVKNRWPWCRWVSFHVPGPSICQKKEPMDGSVFCLFSPMGPGALGMDSFPHGFHST